MIMRDLIGKAGQFFFFNLVGKREPNVIGLREIKLNLSKVRRDRRGGWSG